MEEKAKIPPSIQSLTETLNLAEEALKNIELSEIPLSNIALKSLRIARLLNEFEMEQILRLEVNGYPTSPNGVPAAIYKAGQLAGREYQVEIDGEISNRIYLESIGEIEVEIENFSLQLNAAKDANVSISSANPHQIVQPPLGNLIERTELRRNHSFQIKRYQSRRAYVHKYVLAKYLELKFSGIAGDVFSRIRERVDHLIGGIVPDSLQRFTAIYDNLISQNPENWSNAVHSCRRVLEDLANAVFPPREDKIVTDDKGNKKCIKLGKNHYINRILSFAEEKTGSKTSLDIIGSHLKFLEDRLKSISDATQKGTHETIWSKEEADRYVVFTYLLLGDILSLHDSVQEDELVRDTKK